METEPSERVHAANPRVVAVIRLLSSEDAATRDDAEADLRITGFAALYEIWCALEAGRDPEVRLRLLRVASQIEWSETHWRLRKSWADQKFVLRRGGKLAGTEQDSASWENGWVFQSAVVLASPEGPTVSVHMLADCRDDASLTPDRTVWTWGPARKRIEFRLQDQQVTRVTASEDPRLADSMTPDVWLEFSLERPQTLAANLSRLVERASLVRRNRVEVDAWTCGSGVGPRRRICVIEYRDTAKLMVSGRELRARRYVETSAPRNDEYWVDDDFGLVRARIGDYELERSLP
ncbi:MAG: hypothetical protein HYY18_14890 [Planctomycetes bacterium]|nr:hypothetical protein [Planctomycetota bacterium]